MSQEQSQQQNTLTLRLYNQIFPDLQSALKQADDGDSISFILPDPQKFSDSNQVHYKFTVSKSEKQLPFILEKTFSQTQDKSETEKIQNFRFLAFSSFTKSLFPNPLLTFKEYCPEYIEDKGIYILYVNQLDEKTLFRHYAFQMFKEYNKDIITEIPNYVENLSGQNLFTKEVKEAMLAKNKNITDKEVTKRAEDLWGSMDDQQKQVYSSSSIKVGNVHPSQLYDIPFLSATPKDNSFCKKYNIFNAELQTSTKIEASFLKFLINESKINESSQHLSFYASDNDYALPQPEQLITKYVTTSKVNCTRQQFGDIFDIFEVKPINAEYVKSRRTAKVQFFKSRDEGSPGSNEVDKLENLTQVFPQIDISDQLNYQ